MATKGGEVIRLINGICAVLLIVLVVVVYAWILIDPIVVVDAGESMDRLETYQVLPGDSLWVIARTYYSDRDPRQVVWEIQQLNDMDSPTIYPYEVLKLPK